MKHLEINVNLAQEPSQAYSYGGESDIFGEDYGVAIGGVSITGIPTATMKMLAKAMISHLEANGHSSSINLNEENQKELIFGSDTALDGQAPKKTLTQTPNKV